MQKKIPMETGSGDLCLPLISQFWSDPHNFKNKSRGLFMKSPHLLMKRHVFLFWFHGFGANFTFKAGSIQENPGLRPVFTVEIPWFLPPIPMSGLHCLVLWSAPGFTANCLGAGDDDGELCGNPKPFIMYNCITQWIIRTMINPKILGSVSPFDIF